MSTALAAAPAAGNGQVASAGMSTDALARRIGEARQAAEKTQAKPATAAAAAPATEGQAGIEAEAAEKLLGAEALATGETGAADGVVKTHGETEPTAEEIAAQEAADAEAAAAAEAAAGGEAGEEQLDLTQVPRLSPEQSKHVGELFRQRIGAAKAKYLGDAEALVATEREARTAAETRAAELETQLTAAKAQPAAAAAVAANDDGAVANATAVKAWAAKQLRALNWNPEAVRAELTRSGVTLEGDGLEAMGEFLSDAVEKADKTLTEHAEKKQLFTAAEKQYNALAEQQFPWLKDTKHPMNADVNDVLQTFPQIKSRPTWKFALGVYAEGMKVVRARIEAAKAKPGATTTTTKTVTPSKVQTRATAAPVRATVKEAEESAATTAFQKSGSVESLAKMFASKRS